MQKKKKKSEKSSRMKIGHVIPGKPVPASELSKYRIDADIHSEGDIANYLAGQAPDETIHHMEKIKEEIVLGEKYEIWDVTTDKDRWWVITNFTNLYSQRHFISLDYTFSFHLGLMLRIQSRPVTADSSEPSPFEEVFRRRQQAQHRSETAVEAEDHQAVGMLLRECLLSLLGVLKRRIQVPSETERPQEANFNDWTDMLLNQLFFGGSNKELRQHLKNTTKETWQLVNWLTHDRNANGTASTIALHSCSTIVGHFVHILERERTGDIDGCPLCKSRNIRTHFDMSIQPDGDYYMTCGVCDWTNHPTSAVPIG